MTRLISLAVIVSAAAGICAAQPGITQNGVVNAASLIPPTLPGGAIARGALFTVSGVRLGSAGHSELTLVHDGGAIAVPIVRVQAQQIDALMPKSAPLGASKLIVTVDQQASRGFPVEISESNPGIFSQNGEGWGQGRIENRKTSGPASPNSTANPVSPGQSVSFVVTGLGEGPGTWMIGNRSAATESRRPTGQPGEEEITVRVPPNAPQGCFVPVYAQVSPTLSSNVVTMAISSRAKTCDSGPVPLFKSEKVGVVALSRARMKSRTQGAPDLLIDDARISFSATAAETVLSPIRLLPPPGVCTAYTSSFQANTDLSTSIGSIIGPGGRGLEAGAALTLSRGDATRSIGESWGNPGNYRVRLGSAGIKERRGRPLPRLFLDPGTYLLEGPGGQEVGPFRVTFPVPAAFEWTDRDSTAVVDRKRPLTLHWKNPSRDQLMFIVARNVDQITTAIGMCLCVAHAADGQFTIPPALLMNLPVSRNLPGTAFDELVLGSVSSKIPSIQASGLSGGFVLTIYATGRMVEYR